MDRNRTRQQSDIFQEIREEMKRREQERVPVEVRRNIKITDPGRRRGTFEPDP